MCPLDYRYSLSELAAAVEQSADVLYVVGGLYGNPFALHALQAILQEEPGAQVVFNGDFNWFNIDQPTYKTINEFVLHHAALRGNVETELAQPQPRGCGCNYPDWVDEKVVDRSDRIIEILKRTARDHPQLTAKLARLPRYSVYRVGPARVGVVHGDAESLSGWGFAPELLADPAHLLRVREWFTHSRMDVYACSHTCLPVLQRIAVHGRSVWVMNNGAAGLPNFSDGRFGVVTRIAVRPSTRVQPLYGGIHEGLYLDAVALRYDHESWVNAFVQNWPVGTPAHESYFDRIVHGPAYNVEQAIRL